MTNEVRNIKSVSHFATGGKKGSLMFVVTYENDEGVINTQEEMITPKDKNFTKVVAALKAGKSPMDAYLEFNADEVVKLSNGTLSVDNKGNISYQVDGMKEPFKLGKSANRFIKKIMDQDQPIEPFLNFVERLRKNPSFTVNNNAFGFIEKHLFAVAEDGRILTYKVVQENYYNCHGEDEFLNEAGSKHEMPRNEVDDNPDKTCSHGLHVCGRDYIQSFRGSTNRLMVCAVAPEDIVSIPNDYGHAKMRTCAYEVLYEIDKAKADEHIKAVQELESLQVEELDGKQVRINELKEQINVNGNWFKS